MSYSGFRIIWALVRHPFTEGPRLIEDQGTIKQGLLVYAVIAGLSVTINLSLFYADVLSAQFYATPFYTWILIGSLIGMPIIHAVYSWIFSKIANALGGDSTFKSVFKTVMYLTAYSSLLGAFTAWLYIGAFMDSGAYETMGTVLRFALFLWSVVMAVRCMARLFHLNIWRTLCSGILTHILGGLVFGIVAAAIAIIGIIGFGGVV